MKCIICKEKESEYTWFINSFNFEKFGVSEKEKYVLECFCRWCFLKNSDEELDEILFNYWKLQQTKEQTQMELKYPTSEQINHPNYYTWLPGIECREVTSHMIFNLGNVVKYVWRVANPQASKYDSVEKRIEDLKKAKLYIDFEIERLEILGE